MEKCGHTSFFWWMVAFRLAADRGIRRRRPLARLRGRGRNPRRPDEGCDRRRRRRADRERSAQMGSACAGSPMRWESARPRSISISKAALGPSFARSSRSTGPSFGTVRRRPGVVLVETAAPGGGLCIQVGGRIVLRPPRQALRTRSHRDYEARARHAPSGRRTRDGEGRSARHARYAATTLWLRSARPTSRLGRVKQFNHAPLQWH